MSARERDQHCLFVHIGRHGERRDFVEKWDPETRLWHQHDSPLSQDGHRQARLMGENLRTKGWHVRRVYVSPFIRTIETAFRAVSGMLLSAADSDDWEVEICVEYGIAEYHEGTQWTEDRLPRSTVDRVLNQLIDSHPQSERLRRSIVLVDAIDPIVSLEYFDRLAQGNRVESFESYMERVRRTMQGLVRRHMLLEKGGVQHILCIGHAAGSIASLRSLLQDDRYPVLCGVCSLSTVKITPRGEEEALRGDDILRGVKVEIVRNGDSSYLGDNERFNWKFASDRSLPFTLDDLQVIKVDAADPRIGDIVRRCAQYMSVTFGLHHWLSKDGEHADTNSVRDQVDNYLVVLRSDTQRAIATFQCIHKGSEALPQYLKEFPWPSSSSSSSSSSSRESGEDDMTVLYVRKLAVVPEYQQHGIGQWCMSKIHKIAEELAQREGSREAWVRLETVPEDRKVIEFYTKKLEYTPHEGEWPVQCMDKRVM